MGEGKSLLMGERGGNRRDLGVPVSGSIRSECHPRDPSHRRGWLRAEEEEFGLDMSPGGIQAELFPAELDIYSGLRL